MRWHTKDMDPPRELRGAMSSVSHHDVLHQHALHRKSSLLLVSQNDFSGELNIYRYGKLITWQWEIMCHVWNGQCFTRRHVHPVQEAVD